MKLLPTSSKNLKITVSTIKRGGTVVYPTDTAYALGGKFDSVKVVKQILKIKHRRDRKFTVICADLAQAKRFFKLAPAQLKLAKTYWPGPLSLVMSPRYSIRVPKNKIARHLAKLTGRPLIATSANLTGKANLYSAKKVAAEFSGLKYQPDFILDGGQLPKILSSTLVRVKKNGSVTVLREGPVRVDSGFKKQDSRIMPKL